MCDQTEVSYLPGDIVWVKLGPVWWPGKVCGNDEVPPEIFKELRKTPIAIVKFFQEDSFEYVKKLTNIYHYNCLRKNEFIKKGMDMYRSSNRDTPSNMKLFPEDIATAEVLTSGNPDIIHDDMFQPEKRPSYAADFAPTPKKTPKKLKIERRKETPVSKPITPRVITHPRFIRHGVCDYEARERKQVPLRAECDEEDNSPPTTYKCTDCDFTTIRLNVMVLHNKSHVRNYAHQHVNKGVKRKSTSTVKFKERKTADRDSSEYVKPAKVAKTSEKPKFRTPHKKSLPKKRAVETETPSEQIVEPVKPIVKKKKPVPVSDEIQKSLLQDWEDFENEQENELRPREDSNSFSGDLNDSTASSSKSYDKAEGNKSCFDFDDSEDGLVIDKSKIRIGRKIPRVLDVSKAEKSDSYEMEEEDSAPSSGIQSNDIDAANASDTNENGIDSADDSFAETHKTSQLQEMGVDNEIEIDSEDLNDGEATVEIESKPEITEEQIKNEQEAEELKEKVEKLLEEITPAPKLPEMPYSMKKAHIKSFNESEELARREAEKNLAISIESEFKPDQVELEAKVEPPESRVEPVTDPDPPRESEEHPKEEVENEIKTENVTDSVVASPQRSVESESAKPQDDQPTPAVKSEPPPVIQTETPEPEIIENNTATPIKVVVESVPSSNQSIVVTLPSTHPTTPVKPLSTPMKITTTPKFKIINQSPLIKVGSAAVKNQTIINKLQSADGKNVVCLPIGGQSPQKFKSFILNPDAAKKSFILNPDAAKKLLNSPNTTIKLPASAIPGTRPATGQKVRLTFNAANILQKSPRPQAPKSPAKSIVLPSSLQAGNVVLLQPQKPIVISNVVSSGSNVTSTSGTGNEITYLTNEGKSYQVVGGATSTTQLLTVDLNQTGNVFITDQSGNLISVSEGSTSCVTAKEDILAKALENTDVLQTDVTLTDVSQSALDTISVAQNTPITYKGETVYETNLTLNTPPIMSAYETPSRALNSANVDATVAEALANDMIIIGGGESNEYVA